MNNLFPKFFENDTYFIDEKVGFFKLTNEYKVYNSDGLKIGTIKQIIPTWHHFVSFVLSKAMLPFRLDIVDFEGNVLATIKRGWTLFVSHIEIIDAQGNVIATIKQQWTLISPVFKIYDAQGKQIAKIEGNWTAWNFVITDETQMQIGNISKKWAGAFKEVFTTADKYVVSVQPDMPEDARKIAIVATAITIDMVLKEKK